MPLRSLLVTLLLCISLYLHSQPAPYPKYYFRNPLAIPMQLAANFGELRPDHWHMGLDIRTDQKENLPVYAAADGYIAHIGVRPESFGRFIIINHPNGLSTLYAHLNDFYPALEQYVTEEQYRKESWAIELDFTKEQFPVTKGAFIAYSGNTGGSQGPHLHFEIFDTRTEKRFNPLLFGFPIEDNVPPSLVKLAMYDRNRSVYDQTAQFFSLKNTDSGYIIPRISVIKTGAEKISFAIQAYDRMSGSNNPNGIYSSKLYLDDEPQVAFTLDSISYTETVYVNAQIDYSLRYNGGAFFQHLSQLPGDDGPVYKKIKGNGIITLADTNIHAVSIDVKDENGNTSQLNFFIQRDDSSGHGIGNYSRGDVDPFVPGKVNVLEKPGFEMYLDKTCLYDTVHPVYFRNNTFSSFAVSALHQVNDAGIPLHDDAIVRIKPDKIIPEDWQDKLVIRRSDRRGNSVHKAIWEEQWLSSKFGELGTFQVLADTIAPQLNELGKGDTVDLSPATRIIFLPIDNFGVIKKFRDELDGRWVRFTNDKGSYWIYIFDDRCPYGVHELKVTVGDLVGNMTTRDWWFKRYPYTAPKKKTFKKKKVGKKAMSKKKKKK